MVMADKFVVITFIISVHCKYSVNFRTFFDYYFEYSCTNCTVLAIKNTFCIWFLNIFPWFYCTFLYFLFRFFFLLLQYLHFILLSLSIFIARHENTKSKFLICKNLLGKLSNLIMIWIHIQILSGRQSLASHKSYALWVCCTEHVGYED